MMIIDMPTLKQYCKAKAKQRKRESKQFKMRPEPLARCINVDRIISESKICASKACRVAGVHYDTYRRYKKARS